MKKLKIYRPAVLVAIPLLCAVFCQAQNLIPIPIPISNSGGDLPKNAGFALYLSITTIIIICMIVRLFLIRKDSSFKRKSVLKNFFFELDKYPYTDENHPNPLFIFLIVLNVVAIIILLVDFYLGVLK